MDKFSGLFGLLLIVLLLTSFIKISTVLGIFKLGLGLESTSLGLVLLGLSLSLSLVAANPELAKLGGVEGVVGANASISDPRVQESFKPFLEKFADANIQAKLTNLANKISERSKNPQKSDSFWLTVAVFLVSELSRAFELGLLLLIPFVIIDVFVANILVLLGVTQISQAVVALPIKLLLFVAVGGWGLLAEKLLIGYS